jgi:hypothetical protein
MIGIHETVAAVRKLLDHFNIDCCELTPLLGSLMLLFSVLACGKSVSPFPNPTIRPGLRSSGDVC